MAALVGNVLVGYLRCSAPHVLLSSLACMQSPPRIAAMPCYKEHLEWNRGECILTGKMRRHAMTTIAAVLCLLLFSARLAAAEKSFGVGGGGGGYGGLEVGGGQQPPQAEAGGGGGGGGGGYSTPSEAAPSTPAAEETTTTPAAASSDGEGEAAAASGGEASAASSGGGGGGYGGAPAGKGLDPDGDPEVGLNEKAINEIVNEHNVFRAKEHVPPLVWNATLAKFSQQYAETLRGNCQQIHSSSPYGENLMEGTPGLTWKITVDGWSEEKKNYHYDTDTCDPGKMCGHYKAVVWKTTTSVGCGRIKCNSGDTIIMCSYWPPGNYDGVKPY